MSSRSPLALAGVLVILLLAVMGFNAFSAVPVETTAAPNGVVLPSNASGRIAASALASGLTTVTAAPESERTAATATATDPVDTTLPEADLQSLAALEDGTTTSAPTEPTTTTAPPTTVPPTTTPPTTVPPTTVPPTTTTAPPTTTTVPPTTTTAPPTTTTVPPTTTTAPPVAPPTVEGWRPVVAAHFPAGLVDEALYVIACESNGDPSAYNPASGASGLFQFIPSTWASASKSAGYQGADVFDGSANIAVAAWLSSTSSSPWQQWSCKP